MALEIGLVANPLHWGHWTKARAYLDPALQLSEEEWPQTEADLQSDIKQLWAVLDGKSLIAAAVTRVYRPKQGKTVEVFLVGGKRVREWIGPLNETIADCAKDIGCVRMTSFGRLGWKPLLERLGHRAKYCSYELVLA